MVKRDLFFLFVFILCIINTLSAQSGFTYQPKNISEKFILDQAELYPETSIKRLLSKEHPITLFEDELDNRIDRIRRLIRSISREQIDSIDQYQYGGELRASFGSFSSISKYKRLENNLIEFYPEYLKAIDDERLRQKRKEDKLRQEQAEKEAYELRQEKIQQEEEEKREVKKRSEEAAARQAAADIQAADERQAIAKRKAAAEKRASEERLARYKLYMSLFLFLLFLVLSAIFIVRELRPSGTLHAFFEKYIENKRNTNSETIKEISELLKQKDEQLLLVEEDLRNKVIEFEKLSNHLQNKDRKISLLLHENKEYEDLISRLLAILEIEDSSSNKIPELNELILNKVNEIESLNRYLNQKKSFIDLMIAKLGKGNTKEVIQKLITYSRENEDKGLLSKCIQISSRYQTLSTKQSNGTIEDEKSTLELSKINKALVDLLIEYENE